MDLSRAQVFDLAQDYWVGMPHHPNHPPFLFSLTKKHGEFVSKTGMSSAVEAIAMSGHTGTHIDALCHFSCAGRLYDGQAVRDAQTYGGGVERLSVDTIAPILRRGVLLDVAGELGLAALPNDFTITPDHLERAAAAHRIEIDRGDVVLVRTGWGSLFSDVDRYIAQLSIPGIQIEGARWLSERGVFAAGADTLALERLPDPEMPVHVHLLVENGIHIVENLNLEKLAAERCYEFQFIATPLKIRGATGAPVRPIALKEIR